MGEIVSPIILVGATTTGKSEIAHNIADITEGHIVNADKFYLYAGDVFMLGLGMTPDVLYDDRPRYLYGQLAPMAQPLTAEEYVAEAAKAVDEIHAIGRIAIIEGCIRSYIGALICRFGSRHAVGINGPDNEDAVAKLISRRGDKLVSMGLYEEAERVDSLGLYDAFPVREGFIYKPAIEAVRGRITKAEARARMEGGGLELALAQNSTYMSMDGLYRLPYSRRQPQQAAEEILNRFQR